MRYSILSLLSALIIGLGAQAQISSIGQWNIYLSYSLSQDVAFTGEFAYSASKNGIYRYGILDGFIQKIDKVAGLSDIDISTIEYDAATDILVIGYNNGNVDLIKDNSIINISDIKDKLLTSSKRINHVSFFDGFAYLSTGFGVVVLDLTKEEIKDTYFIGAGSSGFTRVTGVEIIDDKIFAATDEGVKEATFSETVNLSDFSNWSTHGSSRNIRTTSIDQLVLFDDKLFCEIQDSLFHYENNTNWTPIWYKENWQLRDLAVYGDFLSLCSQEFNDTLGVTDVVIEKLDKNLTLTTALEDGIARPQKAIITDNDIWIADNFGSMVRFDGTSATSLLPNGPKGLSAWAINYFNDAMYVAAGAVNGTYAISFNTDGAYVFENNWWNNLNLFTVQDFGQITDVLAIRGNPRNGTVYYGAANGGMLEATNDGVYTLYDKTNSPLKGVSGDTNRVTITDIKLDASLNVWMSNYGTSQPLVVKGNDGEWYSFLTAPGYNLIKKILIDRYGNKWAATRGTTIGGKNGIVVFNEGADLANTGDDEVRVLGSGAGNGALPSVVVNEIVEDLDGNIWVGTDEGIAVFYCAARLIEDGCDAQQIIVERDGFNGFLFENESVRTIAVDGANRKWVGTTNGAWLISEDGQDEVQRFTADNSPLPSDIINDIEINPATGEVFFATDEGIASYKGDATQGGIQHNNVLVYPNPVRPDYLGPIAIKGLVQNANVKITDVAGTLIFETTAFGGQAIWDGNNYNGRRAKSGVYLVFSSNDDGSEALVTKIMLVN